MLPRHQRLRSRAEFDAVYKNGRSWAHPLAVLHIIEAPAGCQIGISVSKKVGNAVLRNRVRRRMREIIRQQLPQWKPGFHAVFVLRSGAAAAEFADLTQAVLELARRSRLTREPQGAPDTPYIMPTGGRPPRSGKGVSHVRRPDPEEAR